MKIVEIAKRLYRSSPADLVGRIKRVFAADFKKDEQPELMDFYPDDFKIIIANIGKFGSPGAAKRGETKDELIAIVDVPRSLILHEFCKLCLPIEGDIAECGVYKGGTAFVLANVLKHSGSDKQLHLFDSFTGLPDTLPVDGKHKKGDFGDASLNVLKKRLHGYDYKAYAGFFENTLNEVSKLHFCFVHIDVDIYSAAKECTEFFYPRLKKGGIIVYDDYGFGSTKGVKLAVEEFYKTKPEKPVVLPTKQCIIIKK
ncbi:class I SAM-dependent methyltransferase [Candidatus Peregrinibacteria bacterium]|nr:class I SAM-dependent methyltransferase [Candidatus Peregrinibacteria bacterium]